MADPRSIDQPILTYPGSTENINCTAPTFSPVQVKVTYHWTTLVPFLQIGPLTLSSTATEFIEYKQVDSGGN